jgi:tetratricopeptide (TPR) repeat protein
LKATRQGLHVRAAKWFADHDLVLRAQHLDRADDRDAPSAYLEAAQGQASLYHYDRALKMVERGRDLAKGTKDEFALTSLHGQFLTDVGMVPESLAAYRRALELAADDIDRCKSWIGIAAGLRLSNESTDALAFLEQAEPIAVQHGLTLDLARLHHLRGNLYFILGNVDACGEAHGKALEFARKAGSAEAEARSLGGMGDATYARGEMASAHRYFSDCVALCRQQGFGRVEVAHLGMAGWTLHYLNELQLALDTTLVVSA